MKFLAVVTLLATGISCLNTRTAQQPEHELFQSLGTLGSLANLAGGGSSGGSSGSLGALTNLFGTGSSGQSSSSSGMFDGLFGGNTAKPPNSGSSSGGFFDSLFGGSSNQPKNQYPNYNQAQQPQNPNLYNNNYNQQNPQQGATLSGRKFLESYSDCCKRQPGGELCGRTSFTQSCCTTGKCSGLFIKTCSDKFQIHSCDLL